MTTTPDFPISIEHRHKPSRPDVVRAMGAVVGAAVGDALGAPFEFAMAGEFGRRFAAPVIGGTGEMVGGGVFGWAPGEFTDDTQMAIALAEALLAHGGYDPDRVWEWFRTWVETARDVGTRTGASLAHADWRSVPRNTSHSAGNGALMRAFPLALAFGGADRETTRAVVPHQAALTHPDESAGWGAWIAVEMIRAAIRGGDALAEIDGLLDDMPDELSAQFAALLSPRWKPGDSAPSNGSVWGCLAEAVWAVRSTDSYEAAITAAIDLGGDTDTVACVVGAIAGAMYGMQAIPSRWATYVHGSLDTPTGRRSYSLFDLQNLAR